MHGGRDTKMDRSMSSNVWVGLGCLTLTLYCMGSVLNSIWWRPRRLERLLKDQGIRGTSYTLLYGDLLQIRDSLMDAWSNPMPLTHQIAPRVTPFLHQMVQNYGRIALTWHATTPRVIIAQAELMKEILMDRNDHFQKPPLNPLVHLLTKGLSALEREKWAKRRKLMNPAFHHDKIHGMFPTFVLCCENLIKQWKKKLAESPQEPAKSLELDILSEFKDLTSDVIARAAFGSTLEEGKMIFELQKEQTVLAIDASRAVYFPGLRFVPTKKNRRRYEIDKEIKESFKAIIHKKEVKMINGESTGDLLGLLLQFKMKMNNELTLEDLLEECKLFYFAGQETTANLLTWTFIALSMHSNWQEMARQEVLQKYQKENPDIDTVNHLKIVSMVLHEVLRLYPPLTCMFRNTYKATKLGTMTIPAGVDLCLPTILLHHDPKYWGEDVGEFKPDRFADGVSKAMKDDQMAFYPFSWGPRTCLGQSFAMLEAKLALTMVLQNFWFELSPSYTHAPYTIVTLQPQFGAPIILHPL